MYRVIDAFHLRTFSPITRVLIPVTLLLLLLLIAKPGQADEFRYPLTGTQGEWQLTWTDPTLKLIWDGNTGRPGLQKEVTFKNFDPIKIVFQQTKPAPDDVGKPDIAFKFTKDLARNQTGTDWNDFHLKLTDTTPQVKLNYAGTDTHPAYPHFHSELLGADLKGNPLEFVAGADMATPTGNNAEFDGKHVVPNGKTEEITDFVIHERIVDTSEGGTGLRAFEFSEQPSPVPEPSAFLLFGSALAVIGLSRKMTLRRT